MSGRPPRVALVVPRMVSGEVGGSEIMRRGLHAALVGLGVQAELVEVACDESNFDQVLRSYSRCYDLNLDRYDLVISTKAPTFMVRHGNHVSLLEHTIRVFYDRFESEYPNPSPDLLEWRRQIHELDLAAFSSGLIKRRFANGEPVARRLVDADPRWSELPFSVLRFPPRIRAARETDPGEHFLLPGRLHPWKRIDLAIKAVRHLDGDTALHIVGQGSDEDRLRELAGSDPRIHFHGYVSDDELADLYRRAIAIPFVPVEEDFGFITVEAFAYGRPIVTCTDSGEPRRVVEDSDGGIVVSPDARKIAAALRTLRDDAETANRMGGRGYDYVQNLCWEDVAQALLDAGGIDLTPASESWPDRSELSLAVLDTQPIDPPIGGGRMRLHGLYRTLDERTRATYVGAYDWRGPKRRVVMHPPRLEERTIPHSEEHFAAADEIQRLCEGSTVIDVTQPLLAPLSEELLDEARRVIAESDVIVFSHPWLYPPLAEDVSRSGLPLIYDAHNFEWKLRRDLLSWTAMGRALAESVGRCEGELCRKADLVFACSEEDRAAFAKAYGIDAGKVEIVPNGVDMDRIHPASAKERKRARRRWRLPENAAVMVFIGSGYEPNREALRWIADSLAPALPEAQILILGGVSDALEGKKIPRNLHLAGTVDDEDRLRGFHAADVAINPMISGSGTNIKMLDYFAAGLPTLSTPVGARGIDPGTPESFLIRAHEEFSDTLAELIEDRELRLALSARARCLACEQYDWKQISGQVAALAHRLRTGPRAHAAPARVPRVSVVIPSYDRPELLQQLLGHLALQSFRDFEIVIVEQGEKSSRLPESIGIPVRHLLTPIRGAVRARNTGLALAAGDIVAFIDDDCLPDPGWLAAIVCSFEDPGVVAVEGLLVPDRPDADPNRFRIVNNEGFSGIGFMTANLAVRLEAARSIGGFDEIFDHPHFREDTDFGWRLSALGEIPFVRDARVIHPVLPRADERESAESRVRFFEKDPVLFEKHPGRYPDLFVNEGHYQKTAGFWEAFQHGIEKFGAQPDVWRLLEDRRVDNAFLPSWFVELSASPQS